MNVFYITENNPGQYYIMLFVNIIYAICQYYICYLSILYMLFVNIIYAICQYYICYLSILYMLFVNIIYAIYVKVYLKVVM